MNRERSWTRLWLSKGLEEGGDDLDEIRGRLLGKLASFLGLAGIENLIVDIRIHGGVVYFEVEADDVVVAEIKKQLESFPRLYDFVLNEGAAVFFVDETRKLYRDPNPADVALVVKGLRFNPELDDLLPGLTFGLKEMKTPPTRLNGPHQGMFWWLPNLPRIQGYRGMGRPWVL
jgi:hypothetical protein